MDNIVWGIGSCFSYLDDILIFCLSRKEHEQHLWVFDHVQMCRILINPAKVRLLSVRSHRSLVIRYLPRVPILWKKITCFLGRTSTCDFFPTLLLPSHHSITFYPDPESRALIPSPGLQVSTGPSKSARRVYQAPLYWHTLTHLCCLHSSWTPAPLSWVA
jgi:hypothetical protein